MLEHHQLQISKACSVVATEVVNDNLAQSMGDLVGCDNDAKRGHSRVNTIPHVLRMAFAELSTAKRGQRQGKCSQVNAKALVLKCLEDAQRDGLSKARFASIRLQGASSNTRT